MRKKWMSILLCICILFLFGGCIGKGALVKKGQVVVFFEKDMTDEQKEEMKEELSEHPVVSEIEYISAEEAWEDFSEAYFEGDEDALAKIEENPLVDSDNFKISVLGTEKEIKELISYIKEFDGVRKVNGIIYEKYKKTPTKIE